MDSGLLIDRLQSSKVEFCEFYEASPDVISDMRLMKDGTGAYLWVLSEDTRPTLMGLKLVELQGLSLTLRYVCLIDGVTRIERQIPVGDITSDD